MKKIILKAAKPTEKRPKGGIGFYVLLFAAIVTVGTTAHVIKTQNEYMPEESLKEQTREIVTVPLPPQTVAEVAPPPEEADAQSVFVDESQWQSDDVLPVAEEEEEKAIEVSLPIASMLPPVEGKILKPHSDTELVYSKTMEDWRLHKGVDISASIGATVYAAATGTVSDCYTDTARGVTIVLDHGNGILSMYSNLASTDMVAVGQSVEAGTAIGVVGDTAEFEIADEAHLHFEVIKNGLSVNPDEYIK